MTCLRGTLRFAALISGDAPNSAIKPRFLPRYGLPVVDRPCATPHLPGTPASHTLSPRSGYPHATAWYGPVLRCPRHAAVAMPSSCSCCPVVSTLGSGDGRSVPCKRVDRVLRLPWVHTDVRDEQLPLQPCDTSKRSTRHPHRGNNTVSCLRQPHRLTYMLTLDPVYLAEIAQRTTQTSRLPSTTPSPRPWTRPRASRTARRSSRSRRRCAAR